ncbi:hypothetical protein BZA77DRAFT_328141 [Pyronema omphalodes]|nr:hypothetical protein BZA77DRAFT_328141 [Pyronema omphalodes]
MTQLFENPKMEKLHHNWVEKQVQNSRASGNQSAIQLFYQSKLARQKITKQLNDTMGRLQRPHIASMDASIRPADYEGSAIPPIVVESLTSGVYDLCKKGYIDNCDKDPLAWEHFKHLILIVFYEDGDNIRCEVEHFRHDTGKGQFSLGKDKKVLFPKTEKLGCITFNEADVIPHFQSSSGSCPNGSNVLSLNLDELAEMIEKTMKVLGKKPAGEYVHGLPKH